MTEPSNQPVANLAVSEEKRNPLGLLDLPSELRLMIYRHLLVTPHCLDLGRSEFRPRPSVNILRTCRLIHGEAFHVLYGENRFSNRFKGSTYSLARFPRVMDTIRSIHVEILLIYHHSAKLTRFLIRDFARNMHEFGHPSITRNTLTVNLRFMGYCPHPNSSILVEEFIPLKWCIRALRQFSNFRTIEVHCTCLGSRSPNFEGLDSLEPLLEAVLGHAEDCNRDEYGLRFYPLAHRSRRRKLKDGHGDWANSLDGIRLKWNENSTIPEYSETSR